MGKLGKKIKVAESRMVQHQEEYLENVLNNAEHSEAEQGGVAQQIPEVNQQMQTTTQPATPAPQPQVAQPAVVSTNSLPNNGRAGVGLTGEGRGEGLPIPYNEVLKNVGAKIPYSIYDRLERIKRQSERSGIKADKRNIGDLIAQAIKEFVEKYDVQ